MKIVEDQLRSVKSAVDEERLAFAECALQAIIAYELEEDEWGRQLLLTVRAWGLGGPLEEDCLPEVEVAG